MLKGVIENNYYELYRIQIFLSLNSLRKSYSYLLIVCVSPKKSIFICSKLAFLLVCAPPSTSNSIGKLSSALAQCLDAIVNAAVQRGCVFCISTVVSGAPR